MTKRVIERRLAHHRLAGAGATSVEEVVASMGAMQAQDYPGALWAVGLRLPGAKLADVEDAVRRGTIVRTWPMRGTLHFVPAADVRWMLALAGARMLPRLQSYRERLGLDEATLARAGEVLRALLDDGAARSRVELARQLDEAGISTAEGRAYHIFMFHALRGAICCGPPAGRVHTFARLDAWAPKQRAFSDDEALALLARRYLNGHAPATARDFAWWSGLPLNQARRALELLEPAETAVSGRARSPRAHLLPAFDEYLLGYKDRDDVLDPARADDIAPGGNGVFRPTIVVDGRVAGTWSRKLGKQRATIDLCPFDPLDAAAADAVEEAAARYAAFMSRDLALTWSRRPRAPRRRGAAARPGTAAG